MLDQSACRECGREGCEDHAVGLKVLRAADVIALPQLPEVVGGVAFAGGLTVIASESGTGKTFLGLSMGANVSDGTTWHGRQTLQGSVAYLAFEGDALGLRLQALKEAFGHRLEHMYVIRCVDPLSPRVTRDGGEQRSVGEVAVATALHELSTELNAKRLPPIVLIIVDTVRASLSGSEDSSEHVSAYLRAVRRLLVPLPGAAAILVHHAGWQDGIDRRKRERGSSAFRGNVDATLFLELGEYDDKTGQAELTLRTLKVRDAERPAPLHLIRRRVYLPLRDRHGQPVTSCVIDRDRRTRKDREAEQVRDAEAAQLVLDRRVLGVIRDHAITSNGSLRSFVGGRHAAVVDAVGRVLRAGWATKAGQRLPFVLTDEGRSVLAAESTS
jgi:RecA-family ATPase